MSLFSHILKLSRKENNTNSISDHRNKTTYMEVNKDYMKVLYGVILFFFLNAGYTD